MKKIICILVTGILILSFTLTSLAADRTYRGVIKYIGYDLNENRMRVDVFNDSNQNMGRGQLYLTNETSKKLAGMIQDAFINNIKVEVWVHVTDSQGRPNVIYVVNFSKL